MSPGQKHRLAPELLEVIFDGHYVGEALEWMELVVGHVQDRDIGPSGVFKEKGVTIPISFYRSLQNPDAEAHGVTGHDFCGVLYGLAGGFLRFEPHRFWLEVLSMSAELRGRRLKGLARPDRWVEKEHEKRAIFQK